MWGLHFQWSCNSSSSSRRLQCSARGYAEGPYGLAGGYGFLSEHRLAPEASHGVAVRFGVG